jgi:DNA-directed RNA polymerase II subunit RPB2
VDHEIHLHSDEGRILRPIFDARHPDFPPTTPSTTSDTWWDDAVESGVIVYVDGYEVDFATVAMRPENVVVGTTDFLEIHPSLILGVSANRIPFPEHSQAPRNLYSSSMMKQAIGFYCSNYQRRFDNAGYILHYPQKRLVSTLYSTECHMEENPSGVNAIVAIACYTGFNMEDSILLNRHAIDRGLFRSTVYRTVSICETKHGTRVHERIEMPPADLCVVSYDYSQLGDDGIIRVGAKVTATHVLVGRVSYLNEVAERDTSLICGPAEVGVVDAVAVTYNAQGYMLVKVKIRHEDIPEIGDKFANLEAQKGTCGMIYSQEDLPFNSEGMVPDVIVNSHCIPSRMTINMLLEQLTGKASCFTGKFQDATAFCHGDELVQEVERVLLEEGYESRGDEVFYNGMTGRPFKMKLFMGVCYYQRLKHLVASKMHARATGNVQALTRQPTEGRSKDGGLRYGEMERDVAISQGTSIFLKERLFDMSDPYQVWVCTACGHMINNGVDECALCGSDQRCRMNLPYASKLLFQELNAMGIKIELG